MNFLMANSSQLDHYHSKMNQFEYDQFVKGMPTLPCFTNGEEPMDYAQKVTKTLQQLSVSQQVSVYLPFWLHNTMVTRPLFYVDNIDESVFGGDPPNPRLVQPKNAIVTKIASQGDHRQDFYMTGFDSEANPTEIIKGLKLILREIYDLLAKNRTMNIFMGKWAAVRIINSQIIEAEIHTVGAVMQYGIQTTLRDHFLKKAPRVHSVYHFGLDVPADELDELVVNASQ